MFPSILAFITAFSITFIAMPSIIRIAVEKKLYDRPNERSAHFEPTPSLGGIGIFGGVICALVLWTPVQQFEQLQYVLAAFVIILLIGIKDDLMPLSPSKKFIGQVMAAIILVYKSHIKVTSLYGILGIGVLPEPISFMLSILAIVGIINAFNLIDGINGLAGSIGLLASLTWGIWFLLAGHIVLAVLAFSLAGATVAFLKYNFTPARIFMGDTGSMLIGTVCAVLALRFIEMQGDTPYHTFKFNAAPAIAIGILILPLFDTSRVLIRRMLLGKSPFSPDRSHIHHLLLDSGLSHMQATAALIGVNIFFIAVVMLLHDLEATTLLVLELFIAILFSSFVYYFALRRKQQVPNKL